MATTRIDVKNAFERAGRKSEQAEEISRVLDEYVKSDNGLATKAEFDKSVAR